MRAAYRSFHRWSSNDEVALATVSHRQLKRKRHQRCRNWVVSGKSTKGWLSVVHVDREPPIKSAPQGPHLAIQPRNETSVQAPMARWLDEGFVMPLVTGANRASAQYRFLLSAGQDYAQSDSALGRLLRCLPEFAVTAPNHFCCRESGPIDPSSAVWTGDCGVLTFQRVVFATTFSTFRLRTGRGMPNRVRHSATSRAGSAAVRRRSSTSRAPCRTGNSSSKDWIVAIWSGNWRAHLPSPLALHPLFQRVPQRQPQQVFQRGALIPAFGHAQFTWLGVETGDGQRTDDRFPQPVFPAGREQLAPQCVPSQSAPQRQRQIPRPKVAGAFDAPPAHVQRPPLGRFGCRCRRDRCRAVGQWQLRGAGLAVEQFVELLPTGGDVCVPAQPFPQRGDGDLGRRHLPDFSETERVIPQKTISATLTAEDELTVSKRLTG